MGLRDNTASQCDHWLAVLSKNTHQKPRFCELGEARHGKARPLEMALGSGLCARMETRACSEPLVH